MATISAGDFRNGVTIEFEGNIYQIIEFQHVKPGKGAAFVRTKLKNIVNGGVVEKTFRPTEKCETAHIDRKNMQYLYEDGDLYYFMDNETYDQIALGKDVVGDALKFVKENENVKVVSHAGNVFAIEPEINVVLEVTECEPGVKGNTATVSVVFLFCIKFGNIPAVFTYIKSMGTVKLSGTDELIQNREEIWEKKARY